MQQRDYFYELLIRGTAEGIGGAHYCTMHEVLDDSGKVIAANASDPIPLSLIASDAVLTAVIGDALASTLATCEAQNAQIAALTSARDTATAQRDVAQAQVLELRAQVADLQAAPKTRFIKKWQLFAGLRMDDPTGKLLAGVKAYIAALPPAVLDLWEGSAGVEEDSPFLSAFKAAFSITDAQVNSMFDRYTRITQADVLAIA
jgi:hypothetical protein